MARDRTRWWQHAAAGVIVAAAALALLPASGGAQDDLSARIGALVEPAFPPAGPGGVVLVAREGKPVFRRAYGMADLELGVAMSPDHVLEIGSITKQFTGVAILQLVAAGKLALGDDVRTYWPGFETHGRPMTIEQVLTHTSGLPNLVDLDGFEVLARRNHTVEELLLLTRSRPLHFEPGASFRYSDTGYILLGAIVERLTGLSYGEYVETRIFRPLGMQDSYYADNHRILPRRVRGYSVRDGKIVRASFISMTVPHAAGALASTVDDLLRWQVALRSGGVLPQPLLTRAWAPRTLPDGTRSGYGFGFTSCALAGRRTIEHGGFINGFGANALQLPDAGLDVIVLVNNDADSPDAGLLARRIARLVLTGSPRQEFLELDARQRRALAGTYNVGRDARRIVDRDGALFLERAGAQARRLAALSVTELTLPETEGALVLRFELGPEGRALQFRSRLRCEPGYTATRN